MPKRPFPEPPTIPPGGCRANIAVWTDVEGRRGELCCCEKCHDARKALRNRNAKIPGVKSATHPGSIVGRTEVAEILEVSRQRLGVLVDGATATESRKAVEPDPNFPAPICFIDSGDRPLWWRRAIEDYARTRSRRKPAEHVAA